MSSLAGGRRTLADLNRLSWAQRRLATIIVVAPMLTWSCSLPAGAALALWTLIVVVVLAVATAVKPDSQAGVLTVLFLGWYWFTHVSAHPRDPVSLWALGAGLSLLAFHSATAARATAPGPADLDQAFWRRWLRRVAVIAAGTGAVWGLTAAMASPHVGHAGLTLAAFVVLIGGTAWARWVVVRRS